MVNSLFSRSTLRRRNWTRSESYCSSFWRCFLKAYTNSNLGLIFPTGSFGAVVDKQPITRPLVFSENVPESVLETMPKQKADVIRMEKEIASNLTGEQRLTEAEVAPIIYAI